ncbi:MAG TPA: TA system VapC family ribonuclease toxin [Acidisarcina sp.]
MTSTTYFPDVNVWIALASDRHVHNAAARIWLDEIKTDRIVFCRITELGLVRLLANSHVMGDEVLSAAAAWQVYDIFRADPRITFAGEQAGFDAFWGTRARRVSGGPNAWTDAYLAAFALHHEFTLVTLDRAFKAHYQCAVIILCE